MKIDKKIILVSPVKVADTLLSHLGEAVFWHVIWFSAQRILKGFFIALFSGSILALIASLLPFVRVLLSPITAVVKATPVASFIILALCLFPSKHLSVLISFLMVFPIVYTNLLIGITNTDKKLSEMCKVMRVSHLKRALFCYLPDVMPYFLSACKIGLGLCWKSGIAAEVIGIPNGSIGERLYTAKIYLETDELFAWTIVIIFISVCFEKLFILLLNLINNKLNMIYSKNIQAINYSPTTCKSGGEIEMINISKKFDDLIVLDNFSYKFSSSTSTLIMGKSGSGKTTLISLLLGIEKCSKGEIKCSNNLKISAVFQEDRLCEKLNAIANIMLCAEKTVTPGQVCYVLNQFDIDCDASVKPISELSGGMKRRVALIRALLAGSDFIVFDEAFKGLDETLKKNVIEKTLEYCKGRTLVFVTHDIEESRLLGNNCINL